MPLVVNPSPLWHQSTLPCVWASVGVNLFINCCPCLLWNPSRVTVSRLTVRRGPAFALHITPCFPPTLCPHPCLVCPQGQGAVSAGMEQVWTRSAWCLQTPRDWLSLLYVYLSLSPLPPILLWWWNPPRPNCKVNSRPQTNSSATSWGWVSLSRRLPLTPSLHVCERRAYSWKAATFQSTPWSVKCVSPTSVLIRLYI